MRGKGALNESTGLSRTPDSQAMFAATTKKSVILEDAKFAIPTLEELIYTAFEGRPGSVHLHIPKDITIAEVPAYRPVNVQVPKIFADEKSTAEFCAGFAENFTVDKKPLLMVGYGCIRSGAKNILEKLINTWQIPFVSTMDAKGYISEDNPLSMGIVGTSGDKGANDYFHEAQTVLAVGNSFAENATFGFNAKLFDGKKLFHINIDRHEIDKVYASAFRLVSDATPALENLVAYLEKNNVAPLEKNLAVRNKHHDEILPEFSNGKMHPGFLVQQISKQLPENAIIMGDAGGHMLWLSAYLNLSKNQWYQNPGSFGPMASHVNGSIGVACANPDRKVICACGDGDYLMAGFELLTCVKNNIPVVYVIFNNSEFNVIKKFLLAFLRSFALLIIFLAGAYTWQADLVWWSFLFAKLVTLAVLIIGVKILQRKGTLLPKMPPSNFFVINRQLNLEEQLPKGLKANVAKILSEWVVLNQKFNDRKKDNFTAVQIRTDDEKTFLTLRSNGKFFDYRKYFSENPREDLLRLVDAWKFKFVLGLNNFYAQVR